MDELRITIYMSLAQPIPDDQVSLFMSQLTEGIEWIADETDIWPIADFNLSLEDIY